MACFSKTVKWRRRSRLFRSLLFCFAISLVAYGGFKGLHFVPKPLAPIHTPETLMHRNPSF